MCRSENEEQVKLMKLLKLGVAGLAFVCGLANATPALRLSDGAITYTVQDGQGGVCGDQLAADGYIRSTCQIGIWDYTQTTGISSSVLGNKVHLDSIELSSAGSGTLTIMFTDTGLTTGLGETLRFLGAIGGYTDGQVTYAMYVADSDNQFDLATLIGSGSTNSTGGFSGNFGGEALLSGTYSVTLVATVTHILGSFPSVTSFNFNATVPEPSVLGSLALGLVGLAFVARRRAK
jgi:hypothetical protein